MNKLQTEAMDRNNECAPMEPEFRVLPDLGGAAVRPACTHGEAITQYTGDGSPVLYCPDCGRNEPMGGAAFCGDEAVAVDADSIDWPADFKIGPDVHSNSASLNGVQIVGAAVRGEAPSLTEAELDAMPKRAAFIAWAKDRSLDTTETKDAWGQRAFLHDHIETMWIGWFSAPSVSARAADAPSEPSDEQIISVMKPELDQGDGGYICDMHAEHVVAAGRVLLKSRAADGLDSQPAAIRNAALEEAIQAIEKIDDGEASEYRACQEAISELKGSSQPTDGGVRNG